MFKSINYYFFGGEPDKESAIWFYGFILISLITYVSVKMLVK